MRKLLVLLALVALLVGGWYVGSPWWAMKGLVDDAKAGDLAGLEERIDFPTLRENARTDVRAAIAQRTGQGGWLDEMGGAVAERIANEAIDQAITPAGLATLVASGTFAAPLIPERLKGQELNWEVEREGLDNFRAVSSFDDGTEGPVLKFERDGLGWDVVGISMGLGE